jgi:hypothetical protein
MNARATHVKDRLLELAYGELSADEVRAVEAHVGECPACKGALEEIRGVRRVMAKLSQPAAPQDKLESLFAYAEQAARRASAGPAPGTRWWGKWLAPMGGIAAVVTIGIVAHEVSRAPELQDPAEQVLREKLGAASTDSVRPMLSAPAAVSVPAGEEEHRGMYNEEGAAERRLYEGMERAFGDSAGAPGKGLRGAVRKDEQPPIAADAPDAPAPKLKAFQKRHAGPESAPVLVQESAIADEETKKEMADEGAQALSAAPGVLPSAPPATGPSLGLGGRGNAGAASSAGDSRIAAAPKRVEASLPETRSPETTRARPSRADPVSTPSAAEYAPRAAAAAPPSAATKSARAKRASEELDEAIDKSDGLRQSPIDAARAQAEALSQKAFAAQRGGSRELEARYLREALATNVRDGAIVTSLLLRLCDAHLALGNVADGEAACERVVREFPSSGAAKVASRRLVESRANRGQAGPAAAPAETTP